jgi:hypothetical protein
VQRAHREGAARVSGDEACASSAHTTVPRKREPQHTGGALFQTAAQHATQRVPVAAPSDSAGVLRAALAGHDYDSAAHVMVCDAELRRARAACRVLDAPIALSFAIAGAIA